MLGRKPVSSSRVRRFLLRGEVEKARACLGRPFSMFGQVVHGKGHGTHLGFPTANLEIDSEVLLPLGVYVASARFLCAQRTTGNAQRKNLKQFRCAKKWLPGIMNFGKRPTYPKAETPRPVLELHLLDFKGQVYGEKMEVALHRFLRPEKKFAIEEALKRQIQRDVQAAQRFYKK